MIARKESNIVHQLVVALVAGLLLLVGLSANAQTDAAAETATEDKPIVVWGGVSLASHASTPEEQRKAMPVIGEMLMCKHTAAGCGGVDVEAAARDALNAVEFNDFNVKIGNVSVSQQQGYIITPVVTSETVTEAFEGKDFGYSYSYRIFGNLMILEFLPGEVKYVSAYPFILKRFDVQPQRLSKAQQQKVFQDLYLSNSLGANYFEEMYRAAEERLMLRYKDHNYVQVNEVVLSEEVQGVLKKSHGVDSWKQQIANFFEANLAREAESPILPSALGDRTTEKLQLVFRDASTQLTVPPAGYSIGIDVRRFIRHEAKGGKVVCFMVGAIFTVTDPYGDQIGELKFARRQDSCGVTMPGAVRSNTMYFPESMYSLLLQVAKQFDGTVDDKFIQRNVQKPAGVKNQIQKLRKTMFN